MAKSGTFQYIAEMSSTYSAMKSQDVVKDINKFLKIQEREIEKANRRANAKAKASSPLSSIADKNTSYKKGQQTGKNFMNGLNSGLGTGKRSGGNSIRIGKNGIFWGMSNSNILGKLMSSPVGQGVAIASILGFGADRATQSIRSRDEVYKDIMSYMSGDNVSSQFNQNIRPVIESVGRQWAVSINDLSNYVLEATKAGFDVSTVIPTIDTAAKIVRAYGLSMQEVSELITTGDYAEWFDTSNPESLDLFLRQFVATVQNTKGSGKDIQESLKYTQNARAIGMSSADYFTLVGALSNYNIKGSRAGRTLDSLLGTLLNPDGGDSVLVEMLQKQGIGDKDVKSLGDMFAAIKFSVYDEKGNLKIGEGKEYESMTHAIQDIFDKLANDKLSEAEMQKFFARFGQIGGRGISSMSQAAIKEELIALYGTILKGSDLDRVLDERMTGVSFAAQNISSAMEGVTTEFLYLEEEMGNVEAGMNVLGKTIDWLAGVMRSWRNPFNVKENQEEYQSNLSQNQSNMAVALEVMKVQGLIPEDVTYETFPKELNKNLSEMMDSLKTGISTVSEEFRREAEKIHSPEKLNAYFESQLSDENKEELIKSMAVGQLPTTNPFDPTTDGNKILQNEALEFVNSLGANFDAHTVGNRLLEQEIEEFTKHGISREDALQNIADGYKIYRYSEDPEVDKKVRDASVKPKPNLITQQMSYGWTPINWKDANLDVRRNINELVLSDWEREDYKRKQGKAYKVHLFQEEEGLARTYEIDAKKPEPIRIDIPTSSINVDSTVKIEPIVIEVQVNGHSYQETITPVAKITDDSTPLSNVNKELRGNQ